MISITSAIDNSLVRGNLLLLLVLIALLSGVLLLVLNTIEAQSDAILADPHPTLIQLNNHQEEYFLGTKTSTFKDSTNQLTILDITDPDKDIEFVQSNHPVVNAGVTDATIWVKFSIDPRNLSTAMRHKDWILSIHFPVISRVELYGIPAVKDPGINKAGSEKSPQLLALSGTTFPIGTSGMAHPYHLFTINFEDPKVQTFYFKINSGFSIQLPIRLSTKSNMLNTDKFLFTFWGVVFGAVIAICIHLALAVTYIDYKGIAYYFLFIISGAFLLACGNSITFFFLWPDSPELNAKAIPAAAGLVSIACLMFVKELIELDQLSKLLNIFSMIFITIMGIVVVLPFLLNQDLSILAVNMAVFVSLFILYLTAYATARSVPIGKYLLLGWLAYLIGISLHVGVMFNALPYNIITIHAKEVAVVIEMFLISLGLAQKTQIMRSEKVSALIAHQEKSAMLHHLGLAIEKPLSVIAQRIQYAQATERSNAQHLQDLNEIHQGSDTLLCLVNDMLDIEKMDAGKLALENIPFRLGEVIYSSLMVSQFAAKEAGIEIIPPASSCLEKTYLGDPVRLRQIISNLLNQFLLQPNLTKIRFNVEYIPAKNAKTQLIFVMEAIAWREPLNADKPLAEEDNSMRQESKVSHNKNIELKLSESLLRLMHSKLNSEIVNRQLISTRFTLFLEPTQLVPAQEQQHRYSDHLQKSNKIHTENMRILVVDDDKTNLKVMAEYLKELNISFNLANNGRTAITLIEQTNYQIVFMDLRMPDLDGIETTKIIRRKYSSNTLPIVALTADAYPEIQQECLQVGMNDFLTRPLNTVEFHRILRKYSSRSTNTLAGAASVPTHSSAFNPALGSSINLHYAVKELRWSEEMLHEQLQGFIDNYAALTDTIPRLFQQDQLSEIAHHLHTIRGAAMALNASRLVYFIEDAQVKIKRQALSLNDLHNLTQSLQEVIDSCKRSIEDSVNPKIISNGTDEG